MILPAPSSLAAPRRRRVAAVVVAACLVLVGCAGPAAESSAPRSPSAGPAVSGQDLARAVERELDTPTGRQVRALLASVDGRQLLELYRGSDADRSRNTFSVTKSVVSTLVGLAIADGLIRGVDETLGDLLPGAAATMDDATRNIRLRDLLTMSAGFPGDGPDGPDLGALGRNWVSGIVASREQGEDFAFRYSSTTSHLLTAVLEEATGGELLAFARSRLFDPLGIDTSSPAEPLADPTDPEVVRSYENAGFAWPIDPQGVHVGWSLLKMTPLDMLKLGQLYLDGGRWEGRPLLPAAWVDEATGTQTDAQSGAFDGYGYQWWTTTIDGHHAYAALGFGGQLIEVVPQLGLVVVGSTDVTDEEPLDTTSLPSLVESVIVPAVRAAEPGP